MIDKQTYDELFETANLAEKQGLSQAANWLHNLVSSSHEYPTLTIFEVNVGSGDIMIQCLDQNGIFLPFWKIPIESAMKDYHRFPPLFRVTYAGHIVQSDDPSDLSTPQR